MYTEPRFELIFSGKTSRLNPANSLACWFGAWWPGGWDMFGSPKMKGIGVLRGTLRISNHRAPNQQLIIGWSIPGHQLYTKVNYKMAASGCDMGTVVDNMLEVVHRRKSWKWKNVLWWGITSDTSSFQQDHVQTRSGKFHLELWSRLWKDNKFMGLGCLRSANELKLRVGSFRCWGEKCSEFVVRVDRPWVVENACCRIVVEEEYWFLVTFDGCVAQDYPIHIGSM